MTKFDRLIATKTKKNKTLSAFPLCIFNGHLNANRDVIFVLFYY